ncbi:MAG: protein translocase subunit SecF [Geodermatophilaceae bacterium]|nr:protein translocase subunit SecF [Geodermatophilaceae bacterium]
MRYVRTGAAVLDDETKPTSTPGDRKGRTETDAETDAPGTAASAQRKPWPVRLYLGEIGYDFIGKRKFWYAFSAVLVLICIGSMIFREFNLGVEFAGGERFRSPGSAEQLEEVNQAVEDLGADVTSAQAVGNNQIVVITGDLSEERSGEVAEAIADTVGVSASDVTNSTTSASWGQDVTSKAIQGLLVFLVLVVVFLAVRFQWKMAVGAMVAMFHDLLITAGVYSLVGFEVTPASVIGLLTILGFSLYDTVVVFDKVDENAKGLIASQRQTYSESANLAINQVLMRSINTSIFALLPVLGLLYAGLFLIGEGTLQDLALVLFVGLLAGVYSSIFLAAPVLCDLKEREPDYQKLAKRVHAKRAGVSLDAGAAAGTSTAEAQSPMAAAWANRRRRKAVVAPTATGSSAKDGSAKSRVVDSFDPDAVDDENRADAATGSGGGGTLVASARRSRPRSTRTMAGTAAKPAGGRTGGRRGESTERNG